MDQIELPVGDKDNGVHGSIGLDHHVVDVQVALGEAKAATERPSSLLVSVLRLQALIKQLVCLLTERSLTKKTAGGREGVRIECSIVESSKVARRQVSTTELLAAAGQGSSLRRWTRVSFFELLLRVGGTRWVDVIV